MRRLLGGLVGSLLVLVAAVAAWSAPAGAAKPGGGGKPTTTTSSSTTTSTTSSTTTTTTAPSGHDPILFVHGWNSSGSVWTTMISRFQADGYTAAELNNWSYDTSQSNKTTAAQIATKVAQIKTATGAAKVDLITHSMGGLSSRWYVKFLAGGQSDVDDWVSLGGPNHGTDTANFCFSTACSEMRIGSSFLADLNAGDESPGTTVAYRTWWSPCDTVINPDSSVSVTGAVNTQTACLGHSDLYADATVYAQVRDAIR
jgi:triacylglycerol lipase